MPARRLQAVLDRLPIRTAFRLAGRLVARANAERDAKRYQSASVLYEEALNLAPGSARIRVQAGHMHKEAGDYASAERHYLAALVALPDDPDLAMQLGHFYKLVERPDDAEAAYRRAEALRPGWAEAREEIGRIAAAPFSAEAPDDTGSAIAALLPSLPAAPAALREGFHVQRLGATRAWTRGGYRRVLRGVEAIRGFVISSAPLGAIDLLVDGNAVRREKLQRHDIPGGARAQAKYVFNIWHDFSALAHGPCQIELRVADPFGRSRTHRAAIDIVAAPGEAEHPDSDGIVDPPAAGEALEEAIRARPSMIRPARRSPLPEAPRAILVQRVDQLGDLACSIPALLRLRALFPEARIVGLMTEGNADFARTLDMLDEVVIADFREEVADGRKVMTSLAQNDLRRTLAAYAFDIAIDLGETGTSRPLLLLSGARFLYGFKDRDFPWMSAGFELNSHDPANHNAINAVPRQLVAMVEALGAMRPAPLTMPPAGGLPAGRLTAYGLGADVPYVLLHTGARLDYTRWPGFADLAALLLEHGDRDIVVMGDAALPDRPASARLHQIIGRIPFGDFDALIAGADLFIGNDSGPKHLAALRGVPVVSLHMARLNWNEWGQDWQGVIVSRRVPCAGCGIGGNAEDCGKGYTCLRDIGAEEVLRAALALLSPTPAAADQ